MKLHAAGPGAANAITAYGDGYVLVNGQRHESSVVVLPDQVLPWQAATFDSLSEKDFLFLKSLDAEIILLGTGAKQRFPDPKLAASLTGLEVMDLKAACRTYNILVAEGRKVAAALLFR